MVIKLGGWGSIQVTGLAFLFLSQSRKTIAISILLLFPICVVTIWPAEEWHVLLWLVKFRLCVVAFGLVEKWPLLVVSYCLPLLSNFSINWGITTYHEFSLNYQEWGSVFRIVNFSCLMHDTRCGVR